MQVRSRVIAGTQYVIDFHLLDAGLYSPEAGLPAALVETVDAVDHRVLRAGSCVGKLMLVGVVFNRVSYRGPEKGTAHPRAAVIGIDLGMTAGAEPRIYIVILARRRGGLREQRPSPGKRESYSNE